MFTVGMRVKGRYFNVPFVGTVTAERWHTCKPASIVTVTLDTPTAFFGANDIRNDVMLTVDKRGDNAEESFELSYIRPLAV